MDSSFLEAGSPGWIDIRFSPKTLKFLRKILLRPVDLHSPRYISTKALRKDLDSGAFAEAKGRGTAALSL
jgi:hypothetical protein